MDIVFNHWLDSEYKFKYVKEMIENTPLGLEKITLKDKVYQDTNSDETIDLITETITVNSKSTTIENDTLQSQKTITSSEGRTATIAYDPANLLTTSLSIPGLSDTTYGYDSRGRLTSVLTDTREAVFTYNPEGFLASIRDPELHTTSFTYDAVGRMNGITGPDGSSLEFTYDKNGNMTVLTNPSLVNHGFGYNSVNLNTSYQTPLSGSYSYLYDKDRRLKRITFPSLRQINNVYADGRLTQIQTPEGNIDFSYLCATKLDSVTKGTESVTYGYDGSLVTSETYSGALSQAISYTYDDDFNLSSFTYAGGTENYTYDNDGLLTGAGDFTITRNVGNGLPEAVTGGAFSLSRTFSGYGEVEAESVTVGAQGAYSYDLSRNQAGWITGKSETVQGAAVDYAYTYDPAGRLLTVTRDGILVEEYQYNTNGSLVYEMNTLRGIDGRTLSYDAEDHLLTVGSTTCQYDLDGFLTTRTEGSDVITYNYSSRGELLSVDLPDGRLVEYIHDPRGRRIAKKVNGVIVEKYLWQELTRLLAVYDSSNNILMRFEYADDRMPFVMTQSGVTYYLAFDQVGSLRIVTDTSGNIIKRLDYDSFGSIINDTNPGFAVPFGFAGGLHDRDTGLVRFGYRDYDPEFGRWTAKYPIGFAGGDVDLYGYVVNNPVNWIDPLGLDAVSTTLGIASYVFNTAGLFYGPAKLGGIFFSAGAIFYSSWQYKKGNMPCDEAFRNIAIAFGDMVFMGFGESPIGIVGGIIFRAFGNMNTIHDTVNTWF